MKAYFTLSEAQGGDPNDDPIIVECRYGFQLTYDQLRECETGDAVADHSRDGFWILDTGERFSDVVFVSEDDDS